MVHIHRGKGAKDRYVALPQSTLVLLRSYWCRISDCTDQTAHVFFMMS
jgi:hypothetical protein